MLSASPQDQAALLEVAEYDVALTRAAATLRGLPEALSIGTLEKAIDEIKSRRHDAMVEVEGIRSELARAMSDVELVEARIAKNTERLATTSSAKDAQGLEHEETSLRRRRSDLEDIELAIMEKLEGTESTLTGIQAELDTAEEALLRARDEEQRQSETLAATTRSVRDKRAALVESLPTDLMELYERQRARYGVGASHLRRGMSSASGVALTESDVQKVREALETDVVMCPDSNAILVRTAESGL
jgi:hypothetical protein